MTICLVVLLAASSPTEPPTVRTHEFDVETAHYGTVKMHYPPGHDVEYVIQQKGACPENIKITLPPAAP